MRAQEKSLEAFLFTPNKFFLIPDFQRPYSWEKKHVKVFLEDIENVIKSGNRHYFGGVVYINRDFHSEIIDGQQRVTTSIIFLTALYHLVKKSPEKSTLQAGQIKSQYLWNDYGQEENKMKLKSIISDNEIFESVFNETQVDGDKKLSRIYQAYLQFTEHLKEKDNLNLYLDALKRFDIVEIALDAHNDEPRKIFESINSTGKPLSDGDKIRNFVLMSNDQIREIVFSKYWKKIESSLTFINQDYISDFFRYYLITVLQKEIKLDNVYEEFKRFYYETVGHNFDEQKTIAFYENVLNYLKYYLLLKFKIDNSGDFGFIKKEVFRVSYLQLDVVFSFLMRVLYKFEIEKTLTITEVKDIFRLIENYFVRRLICKINTTSLNKFFPILDKEVNQILEQNSFSNYFETFNFVLANKKGQVRFPQKDELANSIRENDIYNQRKFNLTFILTSIDDIYSKEAMLLEKTIENEQGFSIEHIMPQKLTGKYGDIWKNELGESWKNIHEKWLNTLPNLTLTAYNSTYSNRDFTSKKTMDNGFNQSPLKINDFIRKQDVWSEENLIGRAKWWEKTIEEIWFTPKFDEKLSISSIEKDFYTLDDAETFTKTKPEQAIIFGEEFDLKSWANLFEKIVCILYERESEDFENIITTKEFYKPYITQNQDALRKAKQVNFSSIYIEENTNTDLKIKIIKNLLEDLEYDIEEIKIKLEE